MKLFEVEMDREAGRVTIRRECPERLTNGQKCAVCIAAIGGAVWVALVALVGFWAVPWGAGVATLGIVRSWGKFDV